MKFLIPVVILFLLASCVDELPDLSGKSVDLWSPTDNQIITNSLVEFSWNPVPNANRYRLLASNEEENRVIDTILYGTSFKKNLIPGSYLWQIQAINAVSIAGSEIHSFKIDTALSYPTSWDRMVEVLAPGDTGHYLAKSDFLILWNPVEGALGYVIQVVKPTYKNPEKIVLEDYFFGDKATFKLDSGNYQWRILTYTQIERFDKEINNVTYEILKSPYTQPRTLIIRP